MSVHKKVKNMKEEWSTVKFYDNEGLRYLRERDKDLEEVDKML
jgi:hypothetical protein